MESLMAGTPVLGSDRGGIPELIQDGCTGWLFPAADAEALGARIRQLYFSDEPERCAENCTRVRFDNLEEYTQKLMEYYS
jgi:glycosyltransferase involved in cell wall biosynthesis